MLVPLPKPTVVTSARAHGSVDILKSLLSIQNRVSDAPRVAAVCVIPDGLPCLYAREPCGQGRLLPRWLRMRGFKLHVQWQERRLQRFGPSTFDDA